jgi:hypothetical protein
LSELQLIYDKLDGACCPEDIFGSGDDPSVVFKKLARVCHPDRNPTEKIAEKTFKKLNELKQVADERVRKGIWGKRIPLPHNDDDGFQGSFRVGRFDWEKAFIANRIVGGIDGIALSHLDCLPTLGWREKDFLDRLRMAIDVPVVMYGRGPTAAHRTINLEVCV